MMSLFYGLLFVCFFFVVVAIVLCFFFAWFPRIQTLESGGLILTLLAIVVTLCKLI